MRGNVYAVILCGGSGTRLWPASRRSRPKQFLSLVGSTSQTMIQSTAARVRPLVGDRILVVTNPVQAPLVAEQLPGASILIEPKSRNTAPAIGLAATMLKRQDPDAVMVVLPADHHFLNEDRLREVLSDCVTVAEEERALVTIGLEPTSPHTGYGYIARGDSSGGTAYRVKEFCEKPDYETAERYVAAGAYFWNSGMFVFRAADLLEVMNDTLPEVAEGLKEIGDAFETDRGEEVLGAIFPSLEKISVDYGVMERAADRVRMLPGVGLGWSDVGSWDSVFELSEQDPGGNVLEGDVKVIDSRNCLVNAGSGNTVALIGVEDLVVVQRGGATIVCRRDAAQAVAKVVKELESEGREDLL